ncbi:MAG: primosomal protein [Bacteroidota bacterium]|jgi:primosomal protein N' (replication factor Y)
MSKLNTLESTQFVEVILPLAISQTFTYRVPREMNDAIAIGQRVVVQFGKNKLTTGIIQNIHTLAPKLYEAKYLISILDKEQASINAKQFKLWHWVSEYYIAKLGEVMNIALPSALKLSSETAIYLNKEISFDKLALNDQEYLVVEALEMHEKLSLNDLIKIVAQQKIMPIIRGLIDQQIIFIEEEIEDRYQAKRVAFISLNEIYAAGNSMQQLFESLSKASKQLDCLQAFLMLRKNNPSVSKKELSIFAGVSVAAIKALIDKNIFIQTEQTVSRLKIDDLPLAANFELSPAQKIAYEAINESLKAKNCVLLKGVTSSGKTLIYIRLIEQAIQKNEQALLLLPEIGLTTQLINRLRKHFGNKIGVYHSKFSDNERVECWNQVANGNFQVILGTRSSLFLPFQKLGVIIVDEEHDASYKQNDPAPRYNGRDTAIYLASIHQAKVILGSATPSLESYHNAHSGKYGLVEINERFGGIELPEIVFVDMADENKRKLSQSHFSSVLIHEITQKLQAGEQVILLQNRRGYAPISLCHVCGYSAKCTQCDVNLTYHKQSHELRCHYCGNHQKPVNICPACGSNHVEWKGFGTEKIEDELQEIFPSARIARMDLDSTRKKNAYTQLLSDIEDQRIDIVVGTQMVAKGLDFENVTLVGILNADAILNFPDFRAYERAFQLIEQVSGRSGRRSKKGKVVIQTFKVDHPILQFVHRHAYEEMVKYELFERNQFHYPPAYRMIEINIKHKDIGTTQRAAQELANSLKKVLEKRVLGPEFPLVSRIRNQYINTILIKFERNGIDAAKLKDLLLQKIDWIRAVKEFKSVSIVIDVDPM